jgi:rod shape-determining protein MreD
MNLYLTLALSFLLALLQSTVLSRVTVLGVHPDLLLLVVTSWSLLRGAEEGMVWALIGGSALDLFSGARFGVHTLSLLVVGFLAGLGGKAGFRFDLLMPMLVIPLATLGYELSTMALLHVTGWPVAWGAYMGRTVFSCTVVNTLGMPLVYLAMRALYRRTVRKEITW